MKKGDILRGSERGRDAAFHFIIFLDGNNEESFIGAVLTHSNRHKDNVLMSEDHFEKPNTERRSFEFQFDDTHLVRGRFIKLQEMLMYK